MTVQCFIMRKFQNEMTELHIHDTLVKFPFTPYPSQELYIRKVIEALKGGQHAVLESPTGTGKTLCLLTAVLSVRQERFSYDVFLKDMASF